MVRPFPPRPLTATVVTPIVVEEEQIVFLSPASRQQDRSTSYLSGRIRFFNNKCDLGVAQDSGLCSQELVHATQDPLVLVLVAWMRAINA